MEFEVLGPLRVRSHDGGPELRGRAQHGLLAVLLTSPNVSISDDRLIDELWGDDPPASVTPPAAGGRVAAPEDPRRAPGRAAARKQALCVC